MKCACPSRFGQRPDFYFFALFVQMARFREHYEVEGPLECQMKEKAIPPGSVEMIAGPDEVREAIASLTEAESVKLQRLAEGAAFRLRRHVWERTPRTSCTRLSAGCSRINVTGRPKRSTSSGFLLASSRASNTTGGTG